MRAPLGVVALPGSQPGSPAIRTRLLVRIVGSHWTPLAELQARLRLAMLP